MFYSFQGIGRSGRQTGGSIDAIGMREARVKLRGEGIFVTEIFEEKAAPRRKTFFVWPFPKTVPSKEMTSFMRQMASLLNAGIPLMDVLSATQRQSGSAYLKKIVDLLKESIRQGETLAEGMEKSDKVFDKLTISLVRAGEAGGKLGVVLNQLADYKETAYKRESAIRGAMVYPSVVAFISAGVVIFLLTYVVPKITVIFEDLEAALPLSTTILIAITDILMDYGFLLGLGVCGALIVLSRLLKVGRGKALADRAVIRVWLVGPLVRASILARWSHTTSVLLQSGVKLLEALKLSKEVMQNTLYAKAIDDAIGHIREGSPIAPSLERSNLFPPVAMQMIAAGEKSGKSPEMLMQMARDQSAELEERINALMSLVQPALIVAVGLIVGFIVMAILLPIFEISQHI